MILSRRALFLFAAASLLLGCRAASFAAIGSGITGVSRKSRESRVKVSALKDMNVREKSVSGLTKLRFQASTNYATKPTVQQSSSSSITTNTHQNDRDHSLQEFLFREDHRDMILAGSNNRVELLSNPDKSLYKIWRDETMEMSGRFSIPSLDDPILKVTSTGISFPGLSLILVATVGCKQVVRKAQHNDGENSMVTPELQITLLGKQLQAKGPKPLVWVFNKLTGSDKTNTTSERKAGGPRQPQLPLFPSSIDTTSGFTTHSTNIITAEQSKSDGGDVIFRSAADLTIDVTFPSVLMKILPVSKTTAEKQGSDAILKVIEQDIGPCLDNLQKKYVGLIADGCS